LTEAARLQAEIDKTVREMERSYNEASRKIKKLKDMLNALEQTLSQGNSSKTANRMEALDSALESLSKLSDSLIMSSKEAWRTQDELERKCKASGFELTRLDEVRVLCVKTEGMAADLLCYSLGHLKRGANPHE